MAKSLVIVESPAKAKTINKFLGSSYIVRASMGHVRDLPKSSLGVDEKKNFKPTYQVLPSRTKVLTELKRLAGEVSCVYVATDPDREGEAIGWHLAQVLKKNGGRVKRVLLQEITRKAVVQAFENPATIDLDKVNAQQARRILDRLVGYKISPLLWEKVRRGLSAGRVQSVALRIICERERAVQAFKPEEYWSITAQLHADRPPAFEARLAQKNGDKFVPRTAEESDAVLRDLKDAAFSVQKVTKREKKRNPLPPFITSTLQQEASKKLGFSVRKTMMIAQRLYEGLDIGDLGTVGLITYMRTDSTRISGEALTAVRDHIASRHGPSYLPARPNTYAKRKAAQEAHEAIRPSSMEMEPDKIRRHLGADEEKLYQLIWSRFVASQMAQARFDTTTVDIVAGAYLFRASGLVMRFAGFLDVYRDPEPAPASQTVGSTAIPADEEQDESASKSLPSLREGQALRRESITPKQHFTQPPPRFNEAMLVKELEENGIGRPSTYATIIATLQNREYTTKEKKRFLPTELGFLVNDLLVENFNDIMDVAYTARMEEGLDKIEEGKLDWVKALEKFNRAFNKDLKRASREMRNVKTEETPTDQTCQKCGKPMVIKWGRYGKFMACSGYPECRNTQEVNGNGSGNGFQDVKETCERCGKSMVVRKGRYGPFLACSGYPNCRNTRRVHIDKDGNVESHKEQLLDEKCPQCNSQLAVKHGRFGPFTACSRYPDCRFIKLKEVGVGCPRPGCGGQIVERKSRRGKTFYGCNRYPDCDQVWWNRPVAEPCPQCQHPFVLEKFTKRHGVTRHCPAETCDFSRKVESPQSEEATVGR